MEGRSLYELGSFYFSFPMLQSAPSGDGHPVLVLPGFMASDLSTIPLRTYLKTRGYAPYGWSLGRNYGRGIDTVDGIPANARILERVRKLKAKHGRKVSLIGWSLGGVYAREIARMCPEEIRLVVTLGSPFNGNPHANNVSALFEIMSGKKIDEIDPDLLQRLKEPPPVPSTAIYSRTDGVVAWQCCIEKAAPTTENIGVLSSHVGLGHNPLVLWIIADRLAQPENEWTPFDKSGYKSLFFETP